MVGVLMLLLLVLRLLNLKHNIRSGLGLVLM